MASSFISVLITVYSTSQFQRHNRHWESHRLLGQHQRVDEFQPSTTQRGEDPDRVARIKAATTTGEHSGCDNFDTIDCHRNSTKSRNGVRQRADMVSSIERRLLIQFLPPVPTAPFAPYLTTDAAGTFIPAFISNRIDCCNSLYYGITNQLLEHLQRVLNAAARVLTVSRR